MPPTSSSHIPPVIALLGPDRRHKQERLDGLKRELGVAETDYHRVAAAACDWQEVMATLRSSPFLAQRRLVVVEGPEHLNEAGLAALRAYAAAPAATACLVLWSEESAGQAAWLRGLPGVQVESCEPLKALALERWMAARAQALGKRFQPDAGAWLMAWASDEPERLAGTVDALCSYAGRRTMIALEDVRALCAGPSPSDVYQLLDAVARQDVPQALRIVADHGSADQRQLLRLVGLLIYQATQLWQVETAVSAGLAWEAACEQARVFRSRQAALRRAAQELPLGRLTALLEALGELEQGVKQGTIAAPLVAVEAIIVRSCVSPVGA